MENYRKYIEKVLSKDIAKFLISFIEINRYESIKEKRNSFYNGESIDIGHVALLNIGSKTTNISEVKLLEIKKICDNFNEKEFFFISDWIREEVIEGITLRYDANITWEKFSGGIRHFENYFNSNLPGNWWVGENWCRYISEAMSDSYSTYFRKVFDIPHELIITEKSQFNKILKIYHNYGMIESISGHKEFFEKIFESQFNYLLSDNIYVTSSSIDFIRSQLS